MGSTVYLIGGKSRNKFYYLNKRKEFGNKLFKKIKYYVTLTTKLYLFNYLFIY